MGYYIETNDCLNKAAYIAKTYNAMNVTRDAFLALDVNENGHKLNGTALNDPIQVQMFAANPNISLWLFHRAIPICILVKLNQNSYRSALTVTLARSMS